METRLSPTELSARVGISKGYACDMLKGNKIPSDEMALRVFKATGMRLGPVANLSDDDIEALARIRGVAA